MATLAGSLASLDWCTRLGQPLRISVWNLAREQNDMDGDGATVRWDFHNPNVNTVFDWSTRVTDGRTDEQTDGR